MTSGLQLDQFLSWEARVKENPDKEVNFLVLIKKKKTKQIFLVHSTIGYGLYHLSSDSVYCSLNTFYMSI